MANHCIDVVCSDCGCNWCCRCEDVYHHMRKTKKEIEKLLKNDPVFIKNEKCPECKNTIVVME